MYKIIIADDEPIVRKGLLHELSKTADFELFEAANGQDVINIALQEEIDGILLDIVMPKLSGIHVMEHLASEGLDPIVFVISGHGNFAYAQTMLKYGVKDYILKPISQQEVGKLSRELTRKLKEKTEKLEQAEYLKATSQILTTIVSDKQGSIVRITKELERLAESVFFAAQKGIDDVKMIIEKGFELFSGYDINYKKFFKQHFTSLLLNISLERMAGQHLPSATLAEMTSSFRTDQELTNWLAAKLTQLSSENPTSSKAAYYANAKDYIQQHYADELSVSLVAEMLFISPNYLGKIFKEQSGQGILDFIKNTRLDAAAERLRGGNASIEDICIKTGFSDTRYFSKLFKEKFAVSPKKYIAHVQNP